MKIARIQWTLGLSVAFMVGFQNCGIPNGFNTESLSSNSALQSSAGLPSHHVTRLCGDDYESGRTGIHRLTNEEYNNTVRDLLFTASRPADRFPPDVPGPSGYSNESEALNTYEELMSGYLDSATALAKEVIASKTLPGGAYSRIAPCALNGSSDLASCASSTVQDLASRAFRRPVTKDELSRLMSVFQTSGQFDTGLADVITALLISPKFLFVSVVSPQSRVAGAQFALTDYEIATRLSYFLWQSMPDSELFSLAKKAQLRDPQVLTNQVRRMLKDPKISAFLKVLRNEYLDLQTLANFEVPNLSGSLRSAMLKETDLFLWDLVKNDSSLLTLINGQTTHVNKALADWYGLPFTSGDPNAFIPVPSSVSGRIGVGMQASVLTATAGETNFTHPVKRGLFVARKVLCSPPPPPPPDIPEINMDPASGGTIREKLKAHTASPACMGCHKAMDNFGLGLENYDPFGRWRTTYLDSGLKIDATGILPNGSTFSNPHEMYSKLAEAPEVQSCLPTQMMRYALSRQTKSDADKCVAKAIGLAHVDANSRLSDLIAAIVLSNQFLQQQGEAP